MDLTMPIEVHNTSLNACLPHGYVNRRTPQKQQQVNRVKDLFPEFALLEELPSLEDGDGNEGEGGKARSAVVGEDRALSH